MRFRRPAGVALVAASLWVVWQAAQAQTLPGSPVRPPGAPPPSMVPQAARTKGVLLGQVVDATDGRGVPRAIVRLAGAGVAQTRVADDKGRFYFTEVPDTDVAITATKIGFFDGAYGKHRAGATGVPLTLSNGQWITDLRIELFKAAAISGMVVDEANEPLVGVRVRAWRREFTESREQLVPAGEVTTDDAGMYRAFGLKPGDYILSIPSVQVTMPIEAVEGAADAGVRPPEVSALVSLSRASNATDRFAQPDGKYVLMAGANVTGPPAEHGATFAYRTEFYPGFELPSQALPVSVGSGENRIGVHFQLHLVQTHHVSGIVVGPDGPVARQLLRLVLDGADDLGLGNEAATTITGADGTFTLLNVPGGEYTLRVRPLGAVVTASSPDLAPDLIEDSIEPTATSRSTRAWGNMKVAVRAEDVTDLIVGIHPGATISGRAVVDGAGRQAPLDRLSGMTISLLPEERTVGQAVTRPLNTAGRFGFADLMPASYFLRVSTPPPGWSVKSVTGGGRDLLDQPLDLNDDTEVLVTLTDRPTEVWGTVRDWRGVVTAGATILVLPPSSPGNRAINPNRMREARAATSGVYSIRGLPAGEYYVIAIDDAAAEGWQDPRRVDALRTQATRVSLRDGDKKLLDLRIRK